jgi:M6 family metalloprotease-like protein
MKKKGLIFALLIMSIISVNQKLSAQKYIASENKVKSYGVPASPEVFETTQSTGEKIQLKIKGDGATHWFETIDGYTVLRDRNNDFVYANHDKNKNLVPTEVLVSNTKNSQFAKNLRFSKDQILNQRASYLTDSEKSLGNSKSFPTTGERNVLLLLIDFSDQAFVRENADFGELMNETNYNGTGSFKDFYLTSSYNKLTLTTTVIGWLHASNTLAYYGGNDDDDDDLRPRELVREAIDSAEANGVDFSIFDNDNDGSVDGIQVIHAGYGEEAGASADCIWSHRWSLSGLAATYDGVVINDYAIYPELRGSYNTNITNIGVVCHEFGHSLGLPDYYDIDYEGSGGQSFDLGDWDLMAGGSWNNGGATPANHNCLSKWELGWLEPIEITKDTSIVEFPNSVENDTAFIIYSQIEGELFMFENRQKIGQDLYVPGHGMLIYHYDDNNWASMQNKIPTHQCMDIEEADDIQSSYTYSGDPFPGTSNNMEFSDLTTPSMLAWNSMPTGMKIKDIQENTTNKTISFNVITGDVKSPIVNVTSEYSGATSVHPIPVTIIFDEPVFGFEVEDLNITNGVAENFISVSDSLYTADIEPIIAGQVLVSIAEKIAEDAAGNGNLASSMWGINFSYPTGIKDIAELGFNVYPNPSNGLINLDISKDFNTGSVKVLDITGRVIYKEQLTQNRNYIDISKHSSGMYILNVQLDNEIYNSQIIVK